MIITRNKASLEKGRRLGVICSFTCPFVRLLITIPRMEGITTILNKDSIIPVVSMAMEVWARSLTVKGVNIGAKAVEINIKVSDSAPFPSYIELQIYPETAVGMESRRM